ncbi:TlpA family protein disulfide reductase [Brumimicrobium oceani]|uniref:Thiol-disulfide oxidoreductase n=1 Tax=Brumimicrobium oceani TaxID=2100725 RepID=A0A2U2X348_9FLAO|nr:TlpA disulfide reductase family protein [Brumimicrobium oceani]PWH82203.1 thiol-disulfide oxidoreductase [Brumimicrobium oceani]
MNDKNKAWLKKRKWDIVFVAFIGLMFIPSVRMPVMSFVQRLFAGSPSEIAAEDQKTVNSMDWILLDLEGKQHNFSASHGKITIVNMWATWCPPCVAEMPSLQKLYDKYGDELAFYFVSNEQPSKIDRFMNAKNYTFPVYIPASNYPKEFDSNSLPTTYVLNQEGKIIMEEVGAHDWYSSSFLEKVDGMLGN